MREIKIELASLLEEGEKTVFINGWTESIKYVKTLSNLKRLSKGVYITE